MRAVVCVALVAAAILFVVGVAVERHDGEPRTAHASLPILIADADAGHEAMPEAAPETRPETSPETSAETRPETSAETAHESPAQRAKEHSSERVLGVNPESWGLVAVVAAASFALALALWLRPSFALAVVIVVFGFGAAVFDVREVHHQIVESRTTVEVIAIVVAALHALAGAGSIAVAHRQRTG